MESLPVIFRAGKSGQFKGEVTAVFPTEPGNDRGSFMVYAHVGQHSAGWRNWYSDRTRPAAPDEYASLLSELRGIYESGPDPVRLVVRQRIAAAYDRKRHATLRQGG